MATVDPILAPAASRPRSESPVWMAAAVVLLLAPWGADAVRVIRQSWLRATTPVPTCVTEMHIVHGCQAVARGEPLYPPVDGLLWTFHFYGPLTYLPAGLAGRLLDLDSDGLLIAGRMLPMASMLGILLVAVFYVRRTTADAWAAALAAAMLLYFHSSTLTDFFRNRPETPGLLCTLTGWVVVQRRGRGWPYVAAVLFAAAIAFKQTFLAAPVACGLLLLWARDGKNLLRLTAATVALCAATAALSWWLLGEGYLQHTVWSHTVIPNDPLRGAQQMFGLLITEHWGLLPLAVLFSVAWLCRRRLEGGLLVYFACALLLALATHGKAGASINYHGELSTLMVLLVAAALGHLWQARSRWAWCPVAILLAGTWGAVALYGPGWNTVNHDREHPWPGVFAYSPVSSAVPYAERYAPYRREALILNDEMAVRVGDPAAFDWFALGEFFAAGYLDYDLLEESVRQRRYRLIVFQPNLWDGWRRALYRAALASGYRRKFADENVLELEREEL